jgi:hypothetical protein
VALDENQEWFYRSKMNEVLQTLVRPTQQFSRRIKIFESAKPSQSEVN